MHKSANLGFPCLLAQLTCPPSLAKEGLCFWRQPLSPPRPTLSANVFSGPPGVGGRQGTVRPVMNKYRAMTWVLVVSNIFVLVAMFIAAFWGFTYPKKITTDGFESGKSAYVAAFMCCLAGICLCGLNFQNYYLLCTYAVLQIIVMLNQLFYLLPFNWTRIPNYPLTGHVNTQIYITLTPKILLVAFAFALAYKLRRDEKRYELASTGHFAPLPCHIVPRSEPPCQAASLNSVTLFGAPTDCQAYGTTDRGPGPPGQGPLNGNHLGGGPPPQTHTLRMISGPGPNAGLPPLAPPSLPTSATNQIVQTPPIYPLHRPSVTDVTHMPLNSPPRPMPMYHRPPPPPGRNCPSAPMLANHSSSCGGLNGIGMQYEEAERLTRTRSSGLHHWEPSSPYSPSPGTPTKWWATSAKQQQQLYRPYYRDVYNPNF